MNSLVQEIMDLGNANGKMLNGELTFADNAVELPVYVPSGGEDPIVPVDDYTLSVVTYESGDTDMVFNGGFVISNTQGQRIWQRC